ncbi:MAG: STAS domain-containing protein [SAR324 cluster bacterium]|nr:STAS domain-containing protein [SAR324 cluster bacterium]
MKIEHELGNEELIFKFEGEMIWQTLHKYAEKMMKLVENEDFKVVLFDFEDVSYVDSTGVGLLIEVYKITKSRNLKLAVWGMNEDSYENLVLTGLDRIIVNYDSKADALKDIM